MRHTHVGLLLQCELCNKSASLFKTIFPTIRVRDTSWNLLAQQHQHRSDDRLTGGVDRLRGVVLIENDCVFWLNPRECVFGPSASLVDLSVSSGAQQQSCERKRLWRDHDVQRSPWRCRMSVKQSNQSHCLTTSFYTLESIGCLGQRITHPAQPSQVLRNAMDALRSHRPSTGVRHGTRRRNIAITRYTQRRVT